MYDIVRDSTLGYLLHLLSRGRCASYPESQANFELPREYLQLCPEIGDSHTADLIHEAVHQNADGRDVSQSGEEEKPERPLAGTSPPGSSQKESKDILVAWYSDTDPDNPHNWSPLKKGYISGVILLYTFTVYIGSSLYTSSIPAIVDIFDVPQVVASLGLSLFVLGYGVAPMILSPLSEIPAIGRNTPYIITFSLFFVLCIPAALVDNIPGLVVLRFLLGFFGSPALATGGASYGDFYSPQAMPYALVAWGGGATLGPVSYLFFFGSAAYSPSSFFALYPSSQTKFPLILRFDRLWAP